jgi:hypothetical protein
MAAVADSGGRRHDGRQPVAGWPAVDDLYFFIFPFFIFY